jgi:glycoprotein-N-acetylgalactosamine 3-beta-galactosyltransferase
VPETVNLADYLREEVRVLCVVMTSSEALKQRGFIIMDTWGKRCNKLLFFSEKSGEVWWGSLKCLGEV